MAVIKLILRNCEKGKGKQHSDFAIEMFNLHVKWLSLLEKFDTIRYNKAPVQLTSKVKLSFFNMLHLCSLTLHYFVDAAFFAEVGVSRLKIIEKWIRLTIGE